MIDSPDVHLDDTGRLVTLPCISDILGTTRARQFSVSLLREGHAMDDTRLSIVFADDDGVARNYFQLMLQKLGHDVVAVAENGNELLAACRDHQPDLVVTDLNMPEHDGLWSSEAIESEFHIPVIVVTGHDEPDLVKLTTAGNIHAYLVKPVQMGELKMAIALAMRKSAPQATV